MNSRTLFLLALCCFTWAAQAYPPAPYHRIYGVVRDERGNPLETGQGNILFLGANDVEIVRTETRATVGPGLNYSVQISMDSGTTAQLYSVTALRPMLPFTVRVIVDGVQYVPIQATGVTWSVGQPANQTRLDLTIGIDSDQDGLPDSWEEDLINSDSTGTLRTLADVRPGDDLDGDGLTNLSEYIAGTYALENYDGIRIEVVRVRDGIAQLRFLAITGRTYHIRHTPTLQQPFVQKEFSLQPGALNPASFHRASQVEELDVYMTVGTAEIGFFRLYAQ